jgi:hypothetical protein
MESFLKEQLKRIQDLAEQMSSLEKHAAELMHERQRQREQLSHGPLADVRDLRTYTSVSDRREPRATADDRGHARTRRRRRRE